MTATIDIPAMLAEQLGIKDASDLPRAVLEALTLEGVRRKRISEAEAGRILGIDDCYVLDGFLKQHGIELDYTWDDLEREREAFRRAGIYRQRTRCRRHNTVPAVVVEDMSRPLAPKAVRSWIASVPAWCEIQRTENIVAEFPDALLTLHAGEGGPLRSRWLCNATSF